jgi:hypothetical protein
MCRRALPFLLLLLLPARADEPPVIPVGMDAYRLWECWPYQRIGARAYMRSTYDRRGGNEGADASHFLYQIAEDKNVTLDVQGPGILYFARYNHWHGSPWHYEVDGVGRLVQETSTASPNQPVSDSIFLPQAAFPNPLAWTWSVTKGADLSWVPIPFEESFRMAYSRTHYGTGYYIYHQYVPGAKLSRPLRAWNPSITPDKDVLDLISRSGSDLLPKAASSEGRRMHLQERSGSISIPPHATRTFFGVRQSSGALALAVARANAETAPRAKAPAPKAFGGRTPKPGGATDAPEAGSADVDTPSMLRALEFSVPRSQAIDFGRVRLRMVWDDMPYASVDAPVALFFGAGTLYNRDNRQYLVKAFPVNIRFNDQNVYLACYFPMPFFRSARLDLSNPTETPFEVRWSVRYAPFRDPPTHVGYFHATWRDHPDPEPGNDLVLLDTRNTEGGGDWSGHFIGSSWIFSDRAVLNTLEGDPRFFFDDSQTPQAQGTGTEEWGGGGDYWGGQNMTLPFAGHPTGAHSAKEAKTEEDKIESAYRFLLADLMPFGKNALIRLEHGGQNESTEHYQTVAYWYGINRPSLVKSDELKIGDPVSEREHQCSSPGASPPYEITSRYEWGPDTLNGKEIYPAHADFGRKTAGTSEFNLKLAPNNFGVLLRRKLDYLYPNQRAEVFVSKVTNGKSAGAFQPAGVWYLAGSSTCVYSNPRDELGPAQHIVQTSNRRFRDDEFLVSRKLTQGRSEIRVRIQFMPVGISLVPGQPLPELAWSEIRYDAYCFVMPEKTSTLRLRK